MKTGEFDAINDSNLKSTLLDKPFFNTNEFEKYAVYIIGDAQIVKMLTRAKDRYEFVIGLYTGVNIEDFFWDECDYASFVRRHMLNVDSEVWDYQKLSQILKVEVSVDSDIVDAYIYCEEAYMVEIGLM